MSTYGISSSGLRVMCANIFTVVVILCALATTTSASIINGNFEAYPGVNTTPFDSPSTALDGWNLTDGRVRLVHTGEDSGDAFEGAHFVSLAVPYTHYTSSSSVMSQDITDLTIGNYYQVSYQISVLANNVYNEQNATVTVGIGGQSDSVTPGTPHTLYEWGYDWAGRVFEFEATAETMTLNVSASRGAYGMLPAIDDVTITQVPEPSSSILLITVMTGFLFRRNRK